MRYAPKDAVIASHEVAANVMQTRRLATDEFDTAFVGLPDRVERGPHFDVIEQWRTTMRLSFAIERGS